jgi:hypothetical protein
MFTWNLYWTWFIDLQRKTCINQEWLFLSILNSWLLHKMCLLTSQDSVHKLGLRTWIYLTWKIIYSVLSEIEKHFYKKMYMITLCNFWHSIYSYPNSQHIQNLATEKLYISSYNRSKYNTFVIFLPKLFWI